MTGSAGAGGSASCEAGVALPPSLDLVHLTRVTDILARAVAEKDTQAVICCLVVLEVSWVFFFFFFFLFFFCHG